MSVQHRQTLIPGLLGLGVETNIAYYRQLRITSEPLLGNGASLQSLMASIDLPRLVRSIRDDDWTGFDEQMVEASTRLERGGADFLVLTSNTGHLAAPAIRASVGLPILDIVDTSLWEIGDLGLRRVGLLSTARTLNSGIYQTRAEKAGIEIVELDSTRVRAVDEIIFEELLFGRVSPRALSIVTEAQQTLVREGVDGILLGCTDLTLAYKHLLQSVGPAVVDSTTIHAAAAGRAAVHGLQFLAPVFREAPGGEPKRAR